MSGVTTATVAASSVLAAAVIVLARWLATVHGRVSDLRERVARLEQRGEDEDASRERH